ncbi:MAG: DUF1549 and DUF1553 domain-containing protein [Planctomycetaceae bacterium]
MIATFAQSEPSIRRANDAVTTRDADPLVTFVDQQIRQAWEDNEVQPSERADDAEWLRRVSLDIVGHIPTADEIETFLADESETKRADAVNRLLDDPGYVQNWTTVWANLLIGRQTPRLTSRAGMEKFLREAFTKNRPWNEVVYDVLTAEGHYEENGAVNFLLGQLNGNPNREDYTVEATARVTRLFLGTQVQCTQCHDHPFNDWKHAQFWEFDSFLRQMRRVDHRKTDPKTGRRIDDFAELVWKNYEGPVYYERRSGVMEAAYPYYADQQVDPAGTTDRRMELAKVMARDDPDHQVARAMVNRMWGHFFGFGLTRPVDDMGPHNPPSHPDVIDRLTDEFAASGYDLKQLIRWITSTEAYQLTSQFNDKNRIDDPSAGEVPLFSHMYVKPFTAEQLYESLLIATQATAATGNYQEAEERRRQWMREFLLIFGGNEDDEPTLFSGTIPQALMMMNGDLVRAADSGMPGSTLHEVLTDERLRSDPQRIQRLYLSSLGRLPSRREATMSQKLISGSPDKLAAYQDLYWALLNSNEFVMNH